MFIRHIQLRTIHFHTNLNRQEGTRSLINAGWIKLLSLYVSQALILLMNTATWLCMDACMCVFLVKMLQCTLFSFTLRPNCAIHFLPRTPLCRSWKPWAVMFPPPLPLSGQEPEVGSLHWLLVTFINCVTCYPRTELCWGLKWLLINMKLKDRLRMSKGPGLLIGLQSVVAP